MSAFGNMRKYISNIISPEVPPSQPKPEKKVPPRMQLVHLKVNNRIRNSMKEIGSRSVSDGWADDPIYDFEEIRRAEDKESFLAISFRKHIEMVVKRGWTIRGKNQDFIQHVRERLWEIFILTGVSTKGIIRDVVKDIVRFSNAYIIFKRSDNFPIKGRPYKWRGQRLKPIVGMFRADPANMKPVFRTRSGRKQLVAWKHCRDESNFGAKSQIFKKDDVMHIKWTDKGLLIGTPFAIPVLDDIRALRRVEEFIEMLCSKHAFPLIHYKVGTDNAPAEVYEDGSGRTEIDDVKDDVEAMPTEGCWVTSERHSIAAIDDTEGVDLEKYLKHFEDRVISGCGMSGISLGRGGSANRSCYSEDTQTLTDSGWKYYWQVTSYDKIATFNPNTGKIEYHYPVGGLKLYDYEGDMYNFKGKHVDACVTPDHDMWVGYPKLDGTKSWEKVHADSIKTDQFYFQATADWSGVEPEDFRLPHVSYTSRHDCFENKGPFDRINAADWFEFLGYWVSEGTLAKVPNKYALSISQNCVVNENKTQKIRKCLERLPFKFNEYTDPKDNTTRFWINCKSLFLYLQDECGTYSYSKKFPEYVLSADATHIKIAFEAAMLGDGTSDKRQGRTSRAYYSTSDVLIDQIQEMALKLGIRAHILPGSGCKRVVMSEYKQNKITKDNIDIVKYSGKVYCFHVPNHLFVTRRNGKIGIHGNTATVIDKILIDRAWDIQDVISDALDTYLLLHFHLDSGKPFGPDDMAHFKFYAPDTEEERANENHYLNQYQSGAITEEELREDINRPPLTEKQRSQLYSENTAVYTQERYAQLAKKYGYMHTFPGVKTAQAGAAGGTTAKKAANKTRNKTQPTNQSGTKATKTRVAVNNIKAEIRNLKHTFVNLSEEKFDINLPMAKSFILNSFDRFISIFNQTIYNDMSMLADELKDIGLRARISDCSNKVEEKFLKSLYDSIIIRLSDGEVDPVALFDGLSNDLISLLDKLPSIYDEFKTVSEEGDQNE